MDRRDALKLMGSTTLCGLLPPADLSEGTLVVTDLIPLGNDTPMLEWSDGMIRIDRERNVEVYRSGKWHSAESLSIHSVISIGHSQ